MISLSRAGIAAAVAVILSGTCYAETLEEMSAELRMLRERIARLQQQLATQIATSGVAAKAAARRTPTVAWRTHKCAYKHSYEHVESVVQIARCAGFCAYGALPVERLSKCRLVCF